MFVVNGEKIILHEQIMNSRHSHETGNVEETATDSTPFLFIGRMTPLTDNGAVEKLSEQKMAHVPETIPCVNNDELHRRTTSLHDQQRSNRTSIDLSSPGTLSFHNINYIVDESSTNSLWKKLYPSPKRSSSGKQILSNVSGVFTSGLNAIMGKSI
jgi:hypothetical protein